MKILLLGSGGREHAFAWKLAQSPLLTTLYIAPGNAGTAKCGTNVPIQVNDFIAIRKFALDHSIDMLIVGPEDPLVNGIHDYFLADSELCHIPVIGPAAKAAMLEGSKDFAKQFLVRNFIPTASYRTFNQSTIQDGIAFLKSMHPPYVLKADGLAAGKGVVICQDVQTAEHELTSMITEAKFGSASKEVVIEEFLSGTELSVFVLTDGVSFKILPEAKDYKKIGEGDFGKNTGGMGSVSPVPFADESFMEKVKNRIILPTMAGLKKEGIEYIGFIFFGLINVDGNPFVIEYNCRMGDPETESVIPRVENDLLELFLAVAEKRLEQVELIVNPLSTATVMLVSEGYPDDYQKGKIISGEETVKGSLIFHAGTRVEENSETVFTNGGRVMAITSQCPTLSQAILTSNENAMKISFEGKYFRRDIGFDL